MFIEANPLIVIFCERPTYVDGPKSAVSDFWVQLRGAPAGEFWTVEGRARIGVAPVILLRCSTSPCIHRQVWCAGSVSFMLINRGSRRARFRDGLPTIWALPAIAVRSWFSEC